jgi:hypothetical protein
MARELVRWHAPRAAEVIAEKILLLLNARHSSRWKALSNPDPSSPSRQNTKDHGEQAASVPHKGSADHTLSVPA